MWYSPAVGILCPLCLAGKFPFAGSAAFRFPLSAVLFGFQILSVNVVIQHKTGLFGVQMAFREHAKTQHFLDIPCDIAGAFPYTGGQVLDFAVHFITAKLHVASGTAQAFALTGAKAHHSAENCQKNKIDYPAGRREQRVSEKNRTDTNQRDKGSDSKTDAAENLIKNIGDVAHLFKFNQGKISKLVF